MDPIEELIKKALDDGRDRQPRTSAEITPEHLREFCRSLDRLLEPITMEQRRLSKLSEMEAEEVIINT